MLVYFIVDSLSYDFLPESNEGLAVDWSGLCFEVSECTFRQLNVPFNKIAGKTWFKLIHQTFVNDVILALFEKILRYNRHFTLRVIYIWMLSTSVLEQSVHLFKYNTSSHFYLICDPAEHRNWSSRVLQQIVLNLIDSLSVWRLLKSVVDCRLWPAALKLVS